MVRFATECLKQMTKVVQDLAPVIGDDTKKLSLRVGLHSGAVTAGVLRGEKSRFQLFGDTVNTAARMESNGIRDEIHVSESTAALLYESGKFDWVIKRQDVVQVKGKGKMQTYFVNKESVA